MTQMNVRLVLVAALTSVLSLLTASASFAANGDCGQPASSGANPKASDALFVLQSAVGTHSCELCVCDVTGDNKITASDAQRTLRKAVGLGVTLTCPACSTPLTGVVTVPAAESIAPPGVAAAVVGLTGLVPAAGVTVELFHLDPKGTPILPAVATTTTNADGAYTLTPPLTPGSQALVRATTAEGSERAFVTGATVNVDPASEFVVVSAVNAMLANANAQLATLLVPEIVALEGLVRGAAVDLTTVGHVSAAVTRLNDHTGGVYAGYVADFATGSGPTPALAGNYHLLNLGAAFSRSFQPISGQTPSVNSRSVETHTTLDPLLVAGDGTLLQTTISGRKHTLTEISGSTPGGMGPDLAINASASLESLDILESPGAPIGSLLASNNGALLLTSASQDSVSPGIFVSGGVLGIVPIVSSTPTASDAQGMLSVALRRSSGLTNASLNGNYSAVQFEIDLDQNSDAMNVHRTVSAIQVRNLVSFDGSGHLALGAATGQRIELTKDGPTPDQAAADVDIYLNGTDTTEDAVNGLDYALSANGSLVIKAGSDIVASGAVTPDRNVVVLRIGDASVGSSASGVVVAVKRGTGMNNASAFGKYRLINTVLQLQHQTTTGVPDGSPYLNMRSVLFSAAVGTLDLDGQGTATVHPGVLNTVSLDETSSVLLHQTPPDDVLDAGVSIGRSTQGENVLGETHTYAVAPNGIVTIDAANEGGTQGFLSADGNVFLLPSVDDSSTSTETGFLIALREP